jgi:hemolysin III
MSPDPSLDYPTPAERRADRFVQTVNVGLAIAGCVALAVMVGRQPHPLHVAGLVAYGCGLLALAVCSVVYSWQRGRPHEALYRHLDQASIFLMIAGTYTPLLLATPDGDAGLRLLAAVWAVALVGVGFRMTAPRRFQRFAIPLYLVLGWMIVLSPRVLLDLPPAAIALIVAGGLFYTVGIAFYRSSMRFQEAVWHGFVLLGAACHYAAVFSLNV